MLGPVPGPCWVLSLVHAGSCPRSVLGPVPGPCWVRSLVRAGSCPWSVLGPVPGPCWVLSPVRAGSGPWCNSASWCETPDSPAHLQRAAVSVTSSRKPERGPLSCCSRGPPEGPWHPLIKYTSPPPLGRCRQDAPLGRRHRADKPQGVQPGWQEVQTVRSQTSATGRLINS